MDTSAAAVIVVSSPMKITLHRCFLVALAVSGAFWLGYFIQGQRLDADDRAFHAARMEPYFREEAQRSTDFKRAMQDRKKGIGTPFPKAKESSDDPIKEWTTRVLRRSALSRRQSDAGLGLMITAYAWMITAVVQSLIRMRLRDAPNRPADPGAGTRLATFQREGGQLIARMSGFGRALASGAALEVEVDGPGGLFIFRRVLVVTRFVGNHRYDVFEVPFADVIAARIWRGKAFDTLVLRTAKGKVSIRSDISHFNELAPLFFDAVEANRVSPEKYRALLGREPVVHVPWWGWLPVVVMIAVVFWVAIEVIR